MLSIKSIEISDGFGMNYTIKKKQLELFPLIGGHDVNVISTSVYNQHGETHINSLMQSADDELTFIIETQNMNELQIEQARKKVIDVFNPLKGTLRMTIHLNSGNSYYRDIVITNAPHFPTGFNNRNKIWQRVQIFYRAFDPFFYTVPNFVEDFQEADPLFEFPFESPVGDLFEFGVQSNRSLIVNRGQVPAPVEIVIKGRCVNPRISNVTTGEYLQFKDLIMGDRDELRINTHFGKKRVTLNDFNIFHKLDYTSTFIQLAIGDNIINFTDDGFDSDAKILFYYKNLFVQI